MFDLFSAFLGFAVGALCVAVAAWWQIERLKRRHARERMQAAKRHAEQSRSQKRLYELQLESAAQNSENNAKIARFWKERARLHLNRLHEMQGKAQSDAANETAGDCYAEQRAKAHLN